MDVVEVEAYLLCPTDLTGNVDVLANIAFGQEERGRFVFVRTQEGDHASKNGIGQPEAPSDHRAHEHDAGGWVLATMERQQRMMSEVPEDLRE